MNKRIKISVMLNVRRVVRQVLLVFASVACIAPSARACGDVAQRECCCPSESSSAGGSCINVCEAPRCDCVREAKPAISVNTPPKPATLMHAESEALVPRFDAETLFVYGRSTGRPVRHIAFSRAKLCIWLI